MKFSQTFLDEIRARLPVSQIVSRSVKLKRQGREFVGLSPFKVEKTPSFTVNDQKGFYHCFASGEHGDIFTFLTKTEGLSFPEAVETLAGQAGVAMPTATPQMQRHEDERKRLYELMEAAARFFVSHLKTAQGQEARYYLEARHVSKNAQEQFRIGYALGQKNALKSHLITQGFRLDEIIKAGLVIAGEDIAVPYDRFRNRIIFPICDLKGRVIAFGGRALDPNQPAKYLNSPETPLFHKGHILFNAHQARQPAYERSQLIVVEGYMDVIALTDAGFKNAVAPLGTALTANQLQLLWRFVNEPILCFDGDTAGRKAAYRAVDTALPHLMPGKSLSFAFMPEGLDPDDYLKSKGSDAMAALLDTPNSLVNVLWEKEWHSGQWTTPERRAALEKKLQDLVVQIQDNTVQYQYNLDIKRKLREAWYDSYQKNATSERSRGQGSYGKRSYPQRQRNGASSYKNNFYNVQAPSSSLLNSSLVKGEDSQVSQIEVLLLLTLVNHPWLLDHYAEDISELNFELESFKTFRDELLHLYSLQNSLDNQAVRTHLSYSSHKDTLVQIEKTITHKCNRFVQPEALQSEVEMGFDHLMASYRKKSELKQDLEAAVLAYHSEETEENFSRLRSIKLEILKAEASSKLSEGSKLKNLA